MPCTARLCLFQRGNSKKVRERERRFVVSWWRRRVVVVNPNCTRDICRGTGKAAARRSTQLFLLLTGGPECAASAGAARKKGGGVCLKYTHNGATLPRVPLVKPPLQRGDGWSTGKGVVYWRPLSVHGGGKVGRSGSSTLCLSFLRRSSPLPSVPLSSKTVVATRRIQR